MTNSKRGWDSEAKRQQNSHHPRRQPAAAARHGGRRSTPRTPAATHDHAALAREIKDSVSDIVRRQLELGIDIVNDGEHSKFNFITYGRMRLGGLEPNPNPVAMMGTVAGLARVSRNLCRNGRDECRAQPRGCRPARTMPTASTISKAPITYVGQAEVARDIANLKDALQTEAVAAARSRKTCS